LRPANKFAALNSTKSACADYIQSAQADFVSFEMRFQPPSQRRVEKVRPNSGVLFSILIYPAVILSSCKTIT